MYHLKLTSKAKKELKIVKKVYAAAIIEALLDIKSDPSLGKSLQKDLSGKYSYRIGTYRIVYRIDKQSKTIIVYTIGHRSIVYS